MDELITVSEAARLLGERPRDISDLFYQRRLSDDLAPVVGGHRLIPRGLFERIASELVERRPVSAWSRMVARLGAGTGAFLGPAMGARRTRACARIR